MRKIIITLGTAYIILAGALVGYKVTKNDSCYYNYKKTVAKAEENINIKTDNTKQTNSNSAENVTASNSGSNASSDTNTNTNTTTTTPNTATTTPNTATAAVPAVPQLQYANVKFTQELFEGKKGEDVKKLQEILKAKNYYTGEITGSFDNTTKKALMGYQKEKKLFQDGVLGPGTWNTFDQ